MGDHQEDYIVDKRLCEDDRKELLKFVKELENVERSELPSIKEEICSEDYIPIHKGLHRLLLLLCTEIHQHNFPFNFGIAGINDQFVELILETNLVNSLLHIINIKLSVQSSIDASRILTGLFSGTKQQRIKLIQNGIIKSITYLLKDRELLLDGLVMVTLAAKASKKFCVVFLQTVGLSLIFQQYSKHPVHSLKALYALCTRRVKMKFKLIKPVLGFLFDQMKLEISADQLISIVSIITGKWIPLPPLKKAQLRRIQMIIDQGIVLRLVQIVNLYFNKGLLISTILSNFILILSGTQEQAQSALDHGLMRAAIKCLNHPDKEAQRRSFAVMSHFSHRKYGAFYFFEQKSVIGQLMRKLTDEFAESNVSQLVHFFQNLIKFGNLEDLQSLVDQQILKIIIKHIKLNLNIPNIQLNMSILDLLSTLFARGKELDQDKCQIWKEEFQRNNGAVTLVQLINRSQTIQAYELLLNDF